ncbi:MAG: type I restriction enzyme endonuclease domain-containing protein [Acidobacteriota bacterium]
MRADLRRKIKRLLRKHGYPPDKRAEAVDTVLTQAEALCRDWADQPIEERGVASSDEALLPFQVVPREEVFKYSRISRCLEMESWSPTSRPSRSSS